jgi:hydroxymethylbilane synthase
MNHEKTPTQTPAPSIIRLGARGSTLSRWQANHVGQELEKAWPGLRVETKIIRTSGDDITHVPLPQIGGKGVFTAEIEKALREGDIDVAVHSQKDLPVDDSPGLITAAVTLRENPADALISRNRYTLSTLPQGACVGTSSTRRAAQLLHARPDLKLLDIRGNVDTRIAKAMDPNGPYDAIVVAYAGLLRIGRSDVASDVLSVEQMLPAPAQGALAVQCRRDTEVEKILASINHLDTQLATLAERSFLKGLGGGCSLPIAAFAQVRDGALRLRGSVIAFDGGGTIDLEMSASMTAIAPHQARVLARELGQNLAMEAVEKGAQTLLKRSPVFPS